MDQPFNESVPNPILSQIEEGMAVYDRNDDRVGTVDRIFMGEVSRTEEEMGRGPADMDYLSATDSTNRSLFTEIAEGFDADDDVPETLREQLLRSGFIRIDGGILSGKDRYIVPEQISRVSEDRVYLRVDKDRVIKA